MKPLLYALMIGNVLGAMAGSWPAIVACPFVFAALVVVRRKG